MAKTKSAAPQPYLDRVLELLEMFARNGASMNISEISKVLGVTRVTASNMVQSLLQRNYIEKDALTGKFSLGYKLYELAQSYRYKYPFLYVAEEHVRTMAEKLQIRVNICVLKPPAAAIILLSKDVSLLPKMIFGYSMPLHASASGKALLAFVPPENMGAYLEHVQYSPYTQFTITDAARLQDELAQIRENDVAYEFEEMVLQRACVAAPLRDISGQVIASASFATDKERMEKDKAMLTENIRLLSKSISSNMGYNALKLP